MTITKTIDSNTVTLALAGRLDTITSVQLSDELDNVFYEGVEKLILDFEHIEYLSSAGLRVIINTQKKILARGAKMEIVKVTESIKSIFNITGFSRILTII
jgi:anti-sigma B factor antagonist